MIFFFNCPRLDVHQYILVSRIVLIVLLLATLSTGQHPSCFTSSYPNQFTGEVKGIQSFSLWTGARSASSGLRSLQTGKFYSVTFLFSGNCWLSIPEVRFNSKGHCHYTLAVRRFYSRTGWAQWNEIANKYVSSAGIKTMRLHSIRSRNFEMRFRVSNADWHAHCIFSRTIKNEPIVMVLVNEGTYKLICHDE